MTIQNYHKYIRIKQSKNKSTTSQIKHKTYTSKSTQHKYKKQQQTYIKPSNENDHKQYAIYKNVNEPSKAIQKHLK